MVLDKQLQGILDAFTSLQNVVTTVFLEWQHINGSIPGQRRARQKLEQKLARLREDYLQGDIEPGGYQDRREQLQTQLTALPVDIVPLDPEVASMGTMLSSFGGSWETTNDDRGTEPDCPLVVRGRDGG